MAIIDDRTGGRDYALPNAANKLKDDVLRLRAALAAADGDVTGLLASLAAKADVAHVHSIANVTGLQTALDGKQAVGMFGTLDELTDVSVTGAANGQVLIKQGASWIPIALQVGNVTGLEALLNSKATPADVAALVDSAPAALDTLNELAAALGDDPNFATTVTNSIALKAPLASPALTGAPTAPTATAGTNNTQIANTAFVGSEITSRSQVPASPVALNYLRRNAGNTAYEVRTPAQTLSDIGGNPLMFSLAYESAEQTITSGAFLTLAHGLGGVPKLVQAILRCKTAEHDYAVNDEIDAQTIETGDKGVLLVRRSTTIVALYGTAAFVFNGKNTSIRSGVFLTNANWRLIVRAYL